MPENKFLEIVEIKNPKFNIFSFTLRVSLTKEHFDNLPQKIIFMK